MTDAEQIDEVGWALWARCDSILTVTAAHHGHVRCAGCGALIAREDPWSADERVRCAACGWQISWEQYHRSYRGKQLYGANATAAFAAFCEAFSCERAANRKMVLIDQLLHTFHVSATEIGRPAAANLIEGSLKEVIAFLDALSDGEMSAAGLRDSRADWRRTLEAADWSHIFIGSVP